MKTKEELNTLKAEIKALNAKLAELTEDELKEVTGGGFDIDIPGGGFDIDDSVPDTFKPVTVKDGDNHSALCPYCGKAMKLEMIVPYFADWAFSCSDCDKYFIKRAFKSKDNGWFEGPNPGY